MEMQKAKLELYSYAQECHFQYVLKKDIIELGKDIENFSCDIQNDLISQLKEKENILKQSIATTKIVERKIGMLSQPYKNILYLKHINNVSYVEIANQLFYTESRIFQLHKIALEKYCEIELSPEINVDIDDITTLQ